MDSEPIRRLFRHFDEDAQKNDYVQRLAEAVAIRTVSAELPASLPAMHEMISSVRKQLEAVGATTVLRDAGDGIPPVLLGRIGSDLNLPTIGIYGHLDVQPATKSDGWDTEPFVLEIKDGKMYGRGSTDDKGPVLGWLFVLEAHQRLGLALPVNLVFCLESMEESGSVGLESVVVQESADGGYFTAAAGPPVDCWCISDNYWLGVSKPCVQYGLRGITYFFLEVSGQSKDLHSGKFGGAIQEPMTDLITLLHSLVDSKGVIKVDGLQDMVATLTEEERSRYASIDFSTDEMKANAGADHALHEDKVDMLMSVWRYPSLSIHGIEGAFSGSGAKTVIPSKVTGKFSIRLVPNMTPESVESCVRSHLQRVFAASKSRNKWSVKSEHGALPFCGDPEHPNYLAAVAAVKAVWGVEPDLTRSGGSIPVTLTFQATGKSVLLLPMGRGDDGAHSQNEKLDLINYFNGIKVMALYFYEIAARLGSHSKQ